MNLERVATTDIGTDGRNRITEARELEWLKTAPDRVILYVQQHTKSNPGDADRWTVNTWMGTVVSGSAMVGRKVPIGGIAGRHSYKRSVSCRIFGVKYVGWFFESAGDYCRLRKAKRQ